jgi:hypothetical protein
MDRNHVGFRVLPALALWLAFTAIRALRTGEIPPAGMYSFKKDRSPLMYRMVLIFHAGIVDWLLHTMINLDQPLNPRHADRRLQDMAVTGVARARRV